MSKLIGFYTKDNQHHTMDLDSLQHFNANYYTNKFQITDHEGNVLLVTKDTFEMVLTGKIIDGMKDE